MDVSLGVQGAVDSKPFSYEGDVLERARRRGAPTRKPPMQASYGHRRRRRRAFTAPFTDEALASSDERNTEPKIMLDFCARSYHAVLD